MGNQEVNKIIDKLAIALVGSLCKRIEVIEKISKEKSSDELIKLYPILFKRLAKELTYEHFRVLKDKLCPFFIPTVVYREKNKK